MLHSNTQDTDGSPIVQMYRFAPDVGTRVRYQDEEWTVSGWLCISPKHVQDEDDSGYGVLMQIDHEDCELDQSERLMFCSRSKATHISLRGIGGVVAKIEDCKILAPCRMQDKANELKRIANGLVGVEIF
jgi:hypothetical protein